MPDAKENLIELLNGIIDGGFKWNSYNFESGEQLSNDEIASHLIAHGVTVQEHGYWETVVEVRDNTACGNGVKIAYKRCSRCKNPAKILEDNFCGSCGAKLDLHPKLPQCGARMDLEEPNEAE